MINKHIHTDPQTCWNQTLKGSDQWVCNFSLQPNDFVHFLFIVYTLQPHLNSITMVLYHNHESNVCFLSMILFC